MNTPIPPAVKLAGWLRMNLLAGAFALCAVLPASPAPATNAVRVLSIEGEPAQAEISRAGAVAWDPAYVDQALKPGDRGRTGPRAKVLLRMSDLSMLRVRERSQFEIKPPPEPAQPAGLALLKGMVYLFHRDKPGTTRIQSKTALAATRGTEFLVEVDEATDRMTLTLIDGEADLSNEHGVLALKTGEQGMAEPGQPPRKTAVIYTTSLLQWCLYYPGVLDVDELELTAEAREALRASLAAYREGALPRALAAYPPQRVAASPDETTYLAALVLSVGQVEQAQALLDSARFTPRASRLASALRLVIAAVTLEPSRTTHHAPRAALATEALAASYHAQSLHDLPAALEFARQATELSPKFGFAWARVAELEFSFGRLTAAGAALEKALALSPRNAQAIALKGFLLSAGNKILAAVRAFDEAIAADGALGNAWLGRGLCRIRQGRAAEGREDLQIAAALEPQRALLRSYLGKAFAESDSLAHPMGKGRGEGWRHATNELALARSLDPLDPTAWLYSALLHQQRNQINEAIHDLERSQELNNNRALYRSRLLLDQDRAVRSANLATIYRDGGLFDTATREAARAAQTDYANYSAHLFLADSYNSLRDPAQVTLRYEAVAFSELLMANLLSPAGAGAFSPSISQQEYTRLFETRGIGLSSSTEYLSNGDWRERGSLYGAEAGFGYALDADYQSRNGWRLNGDLNALNLAGTFKLQISPQDTLLAQVNCYRFESGDVRQYQNESEVNPTLRISEQQEPNFFLGWHRQWHPGAHTLFLAGRLHDDFQLRDDLAFVPTLVRFGGQPISVVVPDASTFQNRQESEFVAYSAEAQHIQQLGPHTLVGGGRFQTGDTETTAALSTNPAPAMNYLFLYPQVAGPVSSEFQRWNVYLYDTWQVAEPLWLVGGLSYDHLIYPDNSERPPVSAARRDTDQLAPKGGVYWTPGERTVARAAYTRSLGGLFYDTSARLEPTQVAGFNQAFRSLIPESMAGITSGAEFETWGVGLDHRFATGTYVGLEGEVLESEAARGVGAFAVDFDVDPANAYATSTSEKLEFRERSLAANLNQLVGEHWALGARYRVSRAELERRFPEIAASPSAAVTFPLADVETVGTMQQLQLYAHWQHPSGWLAQFQTLWTRQSDLENHLRNVNSVVKLAGDDFWQFNVLAGYRFPRRRADITAGVLNLTDRDYQLHPVNLHAELPRERTFVLRVRFNF